MLCILLAGCSSSTEKTGARRTAILPFENLTGDVSLEWMGRAASEIVIESLSGSPSITALRVSSANEAYAVRAERLVEGYYTLVDGRLRLTASVRDIERNRTIDSPSAEGAATSGIMPVAAGMAKNLGGDANRFSTRNHTAIENWAKGLAGTAGEQTSRLFEAAIAADPNFGEAYVHFAEFLLGRAGVAAARRIIESARSRNLGEVERARLDVLSASIAGDARAQLEAVQRLASLTPGDAILYRTLGNLQLSAHRYGDASKSLARAAELDPADPDALNLLGYARAYTLDLDGAKAALEQAAKAAPGDANPQDSLGDVHFLLGRFREAESYYLAAHRKNPSFLGSATLLKAAHARWMAGDRAGADTIFQQYRDALRQAKFPLAELQAARWEHLTGRMQQGMERLEKFAAAAQGDIRSLAFSQLAVWKLAAGDRNGAAQSGAEGTKSAGNPATSVTAYLAAAAIRGGMSGGGQPVSPALRDYASAYGALFEKRFADAVPLLERLYGQSSFTSGRHVELLLAWACIETGALDRARKLLQTYPLPVIQPEEIFAFLEYPRVLELRKKVGLETPPD
ncbi:MAG: hypothetical protein HUU41_09270 [Bryobacteraceae bacterium]|nr:hypothetical protein [Bryobacterales bacterium]MEB2360071.1 hypothetical protein [Bryobacterales bacterium]NUN01292.1 hypothetical protein [Bryobacteraceae bacterium]